MSNLKFTWCQDLEGNSSTTSFNTLTSSFGDGYEQNISIGINNQKGVWQYARTGTKDEILSIRNFLYQHKGADSFLWDSPLDGEVRVKSGELQISKVGGLIWRISTTFTQVYYP